MNLPVTNFEMYASFFTLTTLSALSALSSAYKLSHYAGKGCRSQALGQTVVNIDPAGGACQQELAGNAASVLLASNEDDSDFGSVVVFFTGDDCRPSDVLNFNDEGCMTGNYGSFQVWDLWKEDGLDAPKLTRIVETSCE